MKNSILKIGIISCSNDFPEWAADIIAQINHSELFELKLVIIKPEKIKTENLFNVKTSRLYRKMLSAYKLAENILIPVENDSTKLTGAFNLLPGIKLINIENEIASDKLNEIAGLNLDVLLNINLNSIPVEIIKLFKLGVVYNEMTFPDTNTNVPVDWFIMNSQSCIEAKLVLQDNNLDPKNYIAQLCFSPDSFFINRVKSRYYWKASLLTMRGLEKICLMKNNRDGRLGGKKLSIKNTADKQYKLTSVKIVKHICRYLKNIIDNKFNVRQWIILYKKNSGNPGAIEEYEKIIPPKQNFWADPHVIEKNGSYYIFIEEFTYEKNKGHLSVLEITKDGKVSKPVKILEKPYHLSYPFIFEYEGEMFMMPESEQNKTVDIYKCIEFPYKWEFYKHIFKDISAVDSTLVKHQGKWWMFLNKKDSSYISFKDELYLYYSDSPLSDKWTPHPLNPVVADVRTARSAGRIYESEGNLIRPAQDCSVEYGYRIRLKKIIKMNETEYSETEYDIIEPDYNKNVYGMHTLARHNNFTVLDCKIKISRMAGFFDRAILSRVNIF